MLNFMSFEEIIVSYKESCEAVKCRIGQLTEMLNQSNDSKVMADLKLRKNTLSSQLCHMYEIVKILEDYQKRVDEIGKKTY
jgi:hypothetical protein